MGWILTAFGKIGASACYVNAVFLDNAVFSHNAQPYSRRKSGVYSKQLPGGQYRTEGEVCYLRLPC